VLAEIIMYTDVHRPTVLAGSLLRLMYIGVHRMLKSAFAVPIRSVAIGGREACGERLGLRLVTRLTDFDAHPKWLSIVLFMGLQAAHTA
jgi:hypothetical protein